MKRLTENPYERLRLLKKFVILADGLVKREVCTSQAEGRGAKMCGETFFSGTRVPLTMGKPVPYSRDKPEIPSC